MQTYVSAGEAIRGKQEGCNFSIEKLQHVWRRNSSSLHKMMTKSMKRAGGLTYELLQSWWWKPRKGGGFDCLTGLTPMSKARQQLCHLFFCWSVGFEISEKVLCGLCQWSDQQRHWEVPFVCSPSQDVGLAWSCAERKGWGRRLHANWWQHTATWASWFGDSLSGGEGESHLICLGLVSHGVTIAMHSNALVDSLCPTNFTDYIMRLISTDQGADSQWWAMAIHIVFFLHRFNLDILNFDDYSMCGSKVLLNRRNNCAAVNGCHRVETLPWKVFSLCLDLSTVWIDF